MIRALYTSATGLNAQQTVVDNTANNIANVNTNGFKKGIVDFQDLVYTTERQPGSEAAQGVQLPAGLQIGSGVRVAGITKLFSPGEIVNTKSPTDLAIQGDGFFQVTLPTGETAYSRDGAFRRNATGNLVTADGYSLSPSISIPANAEKITVAEDGTVSVTLPGTTSTSQVGQITLARFVNPAGLKAEGRNLFSANDASGTANISAPGQNGVGALLQGYQERSNVEIVSELVNLILAQRAYEFNTRAIRTTDTMLGNTTEMMR